MVGSYGVNTHRDGECKGDMGKIATVSAIILLCHLSETMPCGNVQCERKKGKKEKRRKENEDVRLYKGTEDSKREAEVIHYGK